MKQNRRHFLSLLSRASGFLALSSAAGCAVNPVSGEKQFFIVSEERELEIDRERAPQQFSRDMGLVQDDALNSYIGGVGVSIAALSPRNDLPFNFQVVNAPHINSYALPAGSIAVTRGIMLELKTEDQLVGLLGNEIVHVSSRHPAAYLGRVTTLALVAKAEIEAYFGLEESLGRASLLLAESPPDSLLSKYTLENEYEADALSMEYINREGYNPQGMVSLMGALRNRAGYQPGALALMFATHPMSDDRYNRSQRAAQGIYHGSLTRKLKVEEYQDNIASLRAIQPSIQAQQRAELLIARGDTQGALDNYAEALTRTPADYAALVGASRLQLLIGNSNESESLAVEATRVYPQEAQGHYLLAVSSIEQQKPERALQSLDDYDRVLPGNTQTIFLRGVSYDQMGDLTQARRYFAQYVDSTFSGQQVTYANDRLEAYDEAEKQAEEAEKAAKAAKAKKADS